MREDYILQGSTKKVQIELEETVIQSVEVMSGHKGFTVSQLINTALKRFISQHKDFFPPEKKRKAS